MSTKRKKPPTIEYNTPFAQFGYTGIRVVEHPDRGLRRVDYADKIIGLRHEGWFTADDGWTGEVMRGIVYQLPADAKGATRFVPGYEDPYGNDAAILVFGEVCDTKEQAAKIADRYAERCAESERDYQRAADAANKFNDLCDEIKTLRTDALALGAEIRTVRKLAGNVPAICATLRAKVFEARRQIVKAYKERASLLADYGREQGFRDNATGVPA